MLQKFLSLPSILIKSFVIDFKVLWLNINSILKKNIRKTPKAKITNRARKNKILSPKSVLLSKTNENIFLKISEYSDLYFFNNKLKQSNVSTKWKTILFFTLNKDFKIYDFQNKDADYSLPTVIGRSFPISRPVDMNGHVK